MPEVIRYGQKPKRPMGGNTWSDAQILMAFWEMEEEVTGLPGPMTRRELDLQIPELNPVPIDEVTPRGQ